MGSAVVGNVAQTVRKSIRRSRHKKGGRRSSLHMEIGSVIAMSKSRQVGSVSKSSTGDVTSVEQHSPGKKSMKQKLVKRISSFIPGLGGYNATSSVHPAAPTEKRTKSFNNDK